MTKQVCLVTGVGPEHGTGAEISRRFAKSGYQVAMLERDAERLADLQNKIEGTRSYPCGVSDLDALVATMARVREEMEALHFRGLCHQLSDPASQSPARDCHTVISPQIVVEKSIQGLAVPPDAATICRTRQRIHSRLDPRSGSFVRPER